MRRVLAIAALLAACSASARSEDVGTTRAAIVGGRASGDDENAAVYITTQVEDTQLRCSGRLIAPGLVVSARHCFLKRRSVNVKCNPDGTPVDIADSVEFPIQPPESVSVFIGSNKASQQKIAVRQIIANVELAICRGDVAYLVLAEPGLDQRTPIRRALPAFGETVTVTGWGYVDDTQRTTLPSTRSTTDAKVMDYGPPALPPGVFSVPGGTLCLGDSGAAALVDGGKLLGTYSRIDDPDKCTSEFGRNYLTAVMSEPQLLQQAFAAIGEEPWFDGEQKPWLAKAGASCAADAECASGVCAGATCRAGCGPTGLACKIGATCGADQTCVREVESDGGMAAPDAGPATATPPPRETSGCALGSSRGSGGGAIGLMIAVAFLARRRRPTG